MFRESRQSKIVGGGCYVVTKSGQAEAAFVVVDQYQGQGIGAALMHHLAMIAGAANLKELIADVLPENIAILISIARTRFNVCQFPQSKFHSMRHDKLPSPDSPFAHRFVRLPPRDEALWAVARRHE
jgi:GNAT superfamily N-acetyltransferase